MSSCDKVIPVQNLPGAEEANNSDQLIIQHNDITSILDIKDFILDLDNTTFKDILSQMLVDTDDLIGSSIRVIDTIDILKQYSNTDGKLVENQVVFIRRLSDTSDSDTGGFFVYNNNILTAEIPGVAIKSDISGHWERIHFNNVNVKWFGVSDTSSDNSSLLQQAINYSAEIRKPLYIPATKNSIKITSALNIPSNTHIISNNATIKCNTPANNALSIVNSNNISINNITIDGTDMAFGGSNTSLIYIKSSTYIKITGCVLTKSVSHGVIIDESKHCTVLNNNIIENTRYGVILMSTDINKDYNTSYNIVSQNIIVNNGSGYQTGNEGIREYRQSKEIGYNTIISNVGPDRVTSDVNDNTSVVTTLGFTSNEAYRDL